MSDRDDDGPATQAWRPPGTPAEPSGSEGPATQQWIPPGETGPVTPPVAGELPGAPAPAETVGFGIEAGSWGGADGLGFELAPPVAPVPYRPGGVGGPPPLGDPTAPPAAGPGGASGAGAMGIDDLFGEDAFREYRPGQPPGPPAGEPRPEREPRPPAAPLSRLQRTLLIVVGSVLGLLVLVTLFLVGTRLPIFVPPVTAPTAAPTPEIPAADATGPQPPGTYLWNQLIGGECLEPFADGWQDTYVVVACSRPHHGQLAFRGEFPDPLDPATASPAPTDPSASPAPRPSDPAFPGETALAAAADRLCRTAGALDYAAAASLTDVQLQVAYPVSAEQWTDGNRFYYCFVSRSSGEPLTASIAPTPAPSASAAPAG
ncbi:MAG: hypothetical protein J0G30_03605 [Actinomycetales bacterium]|nr:hypothetical protein [Actinomycetales bacterium]